MYGKIGNSMVICATEGIQQLNTRSGSGQQEHMTPIIRAIKSLTTGRSIFR